MTTSSGADTNGDGLADVTSSEPFASATYEEHGDASMATGHLREDMVAERSQFTDEQYDEQYIDDEALLAPASYAQAPHQWSLPAYGPTNDMAIYRQIIGHLGPPPIRRAPRGLVAGCGVMATLLVALMGLSGFFALKLARAQVSQRESAVSIAATIALFCEAAQNRDYSGAYRYLSATFQRQVPIETFVATNETHDETDGGITSCTAQQDLLHARISGSHVTVLMEVARSASAKGTITLTLGANGWKIDTLDPALELD